MRAARFFAAVFSSCVFSSAGVPSRVVIGVRRTRVPRPYVPPDTVDGVVVERLRVNRGIDRHRMLSTFRVVQRSSLIAHGHTSANSARASSLIEFRALVVQRTFCGHRREQLFARRHLRSFDRCKSPFVDDSSPCLGTADRA